MDVNFKCYSAKQFEEEFTHSTPFFDGDVVNVIVFRPEWDNFGLCLITESNNGGYSANGCGIHKENLNGYGVLDIILKSHPQPITDEDIRKWIN